MWGLLKQRGPGLPALSLRRPFMHSLGLLGLAPGLREAQGPNFDFGERQAMACATLQSAGSDFRVQVFRLSPHCA